MAEMNDETIAHLKKVIAHFIYDELKHYEAAVEDAAEDDPSGLKNVDGHIFLSLSTLRDWVTENSEGNPD